MDLRLVPAQALQNSRKKQYYLSHWAVVIIGYTLMRQLMLVSGEILICPS